MSDMEIEAVSDDEENPFSETAISDKNGKFRIMGLIPGKRYIVKIKQESKKIVIPDHYQIDVKEQDEKSVRGFLIF